MPSYLSTAKTNQTPAPGFGVQRMRQHFSALFIAGALAPGLQAQITINATDNVPTIGHSFTYNTAAYAAAPAGGADQLFNYSTLVATGSSTFNWTDTTAYSHGGLFAAAGAQMMSTNGTDTVFYAVTAAGLERAGEFKRLVVFGNNVDLEIVHTNNELEMSLPLTFGNMWTDQVDGTVNSGGSTGTRTGVINAEADGFGHILLPGAPFGVPVLRVHTVVQDVIQIPVGGQPTTITHKRKQYDYYAPWLKMPILSVYSDSLISFVTVVDNSIRWMEADPVGLQEVADGPLEVSLAPNPASDQVQVQFERPTSANATIVVADAAGRTIASERIASGVRRYTLDIGAWAVGCYAVTVSDSQGMHGSARLLKR